MKYVGITGFMSRAEVDACLAALPAGLTLMCGVLVSQKTLRGERNKWWRRYPKIEDITGIFSDDPRCLNLIHYCSDVPPSDVVIDRLWKLGDFGANGYNLHGFQFNGAWPTPEVLRGHGGMDVVLQLRPDGRDIMPRLRETVEALDECRAHVLIDGSGGRGIPIDPDIADAWGMMIGGCFGTDIGLGFAGGLDAETLPRIADEVRTWGASIDAEGRLRDGDEGGVLNLDKARAYLRAAGEVMLGGGEGR
jgi:hypothetical protein